jgi:DNA-binding protein HU-beta
MNKAELITAVAGHTNTDPKVVAVVLNGTEDVIIATVKKGNEKVVWTGFVGFDQVARKARKGRNPSTGEAIRVKAKKAPRVSAGISFKRVIAGDVPAPKIAVAKAIASRTARKTAPMTSAAPTEPATVAPTKKAASARRTSVTSVSKATPVNGKRATVVKASTAKATVRRATER